MPEKMLITFGKKVAQKFFLSETLVIFTYQQLTVMVLKNINIHLGYLTGAVVSTATAYATAAGSLQKIVHFAEVENEIGFFAMACALSVICFFGSFTKSK